jgi:hypothetical protein
VRFDHECVVGDAGAATGDGGVAGADVVAVTGAGTFVPSPDDCDAALVPVICAFCLLPMV